MDSVGTQVLVYLAAGEKSSSLPSFAGRGILPVLQAGGPVWQAGGAAEGDRSMFSAHRLFAERIFPPKNGPVPGDSWACETPGARTGAVSVAPSKRQKGGSRVERWRGGVGFDIVCFGVSPAVSQ
jgi:hypothetical protein